MFSNRTYIIINVSDVTDEMISSAIQTSRDTLKKSLDGSKAILKWSGSTPSCFEGIETYTHEEILNKVGKDISEWQENIE